MKTPLVVLSPGDSVTGVMSAAVNTTAPSFHANVGQITKSGVFTGVTAVDVVAEPVTPSRKEVHSVRLYNGDAVAVVITVNRVTDAGSTVPLAKVNLDAGDTAVIDGTGVKITNQSGQVKQTATTAPVAAYDASGAIGITEGLALLTKAGVGAMTLASPTAGTDDGKRLTIMSTTAQAHTVTHSAGFGAGGASLDVGTFGGAIGDNICLRAYGGKWYIESTRNVTLG